MACVNTSSGFFLCTPALGKESDVHFLVAFLNSSLPLSVLSEFPKNLRGVRKVKTTYLVYKQVDGTRQLVAATREEWTSILKENRQVPPEKRRRFIRDCFEDEGNLDCMYIEVDAPEHRAWNSQNTVNQKKRKAGAGYTLTSFDTGLLREELDSLHDYVPSVIDVEDIAIDRILIEEIRVALRGWKPWAEELLDFYLSGGKRCCTESLCKRYNLKERTIRKRKEEFNKFILDFLKK